TLEIGRGAVNAAKQGAFGGIAGALMYKPLIYGFSNARIHGMKSLLISQSALEELVELPSITAIIWSLERTIYKEDLAALSLKYSGMELVERAIARNYARTCKKVLKFTPVDGKSTVEAYLEYWDVNNLRTILVGKELKKPRAEIESEIMLVGQMGPIEAASLIDAPTLEDALAVIRTHRYGAVLWQVRGQGFKKVLSTLDRQYYVNVQKKVTSVDPKAVGVLRMLKTELDGKNFSTILRLKVAQYPKERIQPQVIEGGRFSFNEINDMIDAKSVEEAVRVASRKYDLTAAMEEYARTKRVSAFEVEFSQLFAQIGLSQFRKSELSVGTIIGFLMLKEVAMDNIRKIMRGKEFGLPPEQIRAMLIDLT
ncbi:MAG TPA: V-type ATPase subunit, partial [Candidatus Micrarchaeota archaeon]|nr:V-type ATPase subunit [Candidatus Micrarchaeota archaeon]